VTVEGRARLEDGVLVRGAEAWCAPVEIDVRFAFVAEAAKEFLVRAVGL